MHAQKVITHDASNVCDGIGESDDDVVVIIVVVCVLFV